MWVAKMPRCEVDEGAGGLEARATDIARDRPLTGVYSLEV